MTRENRLWAALDLLRSGGMVKWLRQDSEGRHCALGLLDEAHRLDRRRYSDGEHEGYNADAMALVDTARELFPERMAAVDGMYLTPFPTAFVIAVDGQLHITSEPDQRDPLRDMGRIAEFNNHADTTQADLELVFEKTAIRQDEVLA